MKEGIIDKHTTLNSEGKKIINIITIVEELDVRIRTITLQIKELQEAIGGAATICQELSDRVDKVAPKIDIVSVGEANKILKGR